jgi:hypothetical protein
MSSAARANLATVNMNNATLDTDFSNASKAAISTDYRTAAPTGNGTSEANYQVRGMNVVNDTTYLYVAISYNNRPFMWNNDWITVWVDNRSSAAGGATSILNGGNMRVANNQTINPAGTTIEYALRHNQNTVSQSTATASAAATTKNATWSNVGNNLYAPPTADRVVKYRIALANIGYAVQGDELKIIVSSTQGWTNGADANVGGFVPNAALTGSGTTATINMNNALTYIVK